MLRLVVNIVPVSLRSCFKNFESVAGQRERFRHDTKAGFLSGRLLGRQRSNFCCLMRLVWPGTVSHVTFVSRGTKALVDNQILHASTHRSTMKHAPHCMFDGINAMIE